MSLNTYIIYNIIHTITEFIHLLALFEACKIVFINCTINYFEQPYNIIAFECSTFSKT